MIVEADGIRFDNNTYYAEGDVLYLHVGSPDGAVDWDETPEGVHTRWGPDGELVGLTIVNARTGARSLPLVVTASAAACRCSTSESIRSRGLEPERKVTSRSGRRRSFFSEAWFNVTSVTKYRYTLLDRASRNFLGWFATLAEAEETLARFLAHAPDAVDDLEIWDDDEGVRVEIDPGTLRPAPAV